MSATTTASEWAQMVSLSAGLYAALSTPYFLLVEAEVWAWPRPLVAVADRVKPAVERVGDRVLVEAVNARYALRETALWVAALLMLLTASEATR
ncbi:hypothetical protein AB0J81_37915 [Streptomyces bobili]|uniref:hypothetical protein n=1 Tax=Streptomyces bobili TaxID=67280 RepID=UPI00344A9383